jgi:hypothetical protein
MNGSRPSIECYCLAVGGVRLARPGSSKGIITILEEQSRLRASRSTSHFTANYVRSTGRRFPGHRTLLNQPKSTKRGMGRNGLIGELEKR